MARSRPPVGPRPARMLSGRRPAREAAGRPSAVARSTIAPYLFILPALLVYGAFALYPLGRAAQFSLFEWRGFGSSTFVGLQNYLDLAGDADFRAAIANALVLIIFYAVIHDSRRRGSPCLGSVSGPRVR